MARAGAVASIGGGLQPALYPPGGRRHQRAAAVQQERETIKEIEIMRVCCGKWRAASGFGARPAHYLLLHISRALMTRIRRSSNGMACWRRRVEGARRHCGPMLAQRA